mmetsp:Transcript_19358/g.28620  ORF Transcript_19358/g.28620 Transcript_19358/m.28620 type:complete len:89 (+) Transcript_19358:60-326(+)
MYLDQDMSLLHSSSSSMNCLIHFTVMQTVSRSRSSSHTKRSMQLFSHADPSEIFSMFSTGNFVNNFKKIILLKLVDEYEHITQSRRII